MGILRFENVSKSYGSKRALSDISFNFLEGKSYGIIGINGCGKSTLLKLSAGIVRPSTGKVYYKNEVLDYHHKANIALVPEIDYLYEWMGVAESLRFQSTFFDDFDMDKAQRLLAFMKLNPKSKIKELSKGQRVRLKLTMSMARNSRLLLLDEPFSGIDVITKHRVLDSIVGEFRSKDQTMLLSTHDLALAAPILDEVLILKDGRIALAGNYKELSFRLNNDLDGIVREVYGDEISG